jgi:hypothetical protein
LVFAPDENTTLQNAAGLERHQHFVIISVRIGGATADAESENEAEQDGDEAMWHGQ